MKPTLSKLLRRLERRKRLHTRKAAACTRCGAAPGQRGILIVELAALEALPRDVIGQLLEVVYCPGCLVPPLVLLPDNGRGDKQVAP